MLIPLSGSGIGLGVVRVRGIYSTALTKLFIDEGFQIAQPSPLICRRLKIEGLKVAPDISVVDRDDGQGVLLMGSERLVDSAADCILKRVPSAIIRPSHIPPYSVFKGVVKASNRERSIIDLGEAEGALPEGGLKAGSEALVCVSKPFIKGSLAPLTRQLRIIGPHATLILNGYITVSRHIKSEGQRSMLFNLGQLIKPKSWGIRWRSSAIYADSTALMEEVRRLADVGDRLLAEACKVKAPRRLLTGQAFADVEFPSSAKEGLDDVRGNVICTLRGHHYLKALGRRYGVIVDFAERLIEGQVDASRVSSIIDEVVEEALYRVGSLMRLEHVTLEGPQINLGVGRVLEADPKERRILLKRLFHSSGVYDGLNVRREVDDYALTEARGGEWFLKSSYHSKDGRLKGEYYSINTPIEFYVGRVRYVDLKVDVVRWPDGRVEIIDLDELNEARERRMITDWLWRRALDKAQDVKRMLT